MPAPTDAPPPSPEEIRHWLAARLAPSLRLPAEEVPTDAPLAEMGLDSMQFVALVGELEDRFACRFQENPLFEYPTIEALASFLAGELARGRTMIRL